MSGWWKKGELWEDLNYTGSSVTVPRCYKSHPTLKLGKGILCGGNAGNPVVKDADIYVVLQSGYSSDLSSDPWEEQKVVEVHYPISDMAAPSDLTRFRKMIDWLCNQLQDGKKVHVGCAGGHGRTGTVLAAIVAQIKGKKNAIQWVRKHYCSKAVESDSQIKFLVKHYGVEEVTPSKTLSTVTIGKSVVTMPTKLVHSRESLTQPESGRVRTIVPSGVSKSTRSYAPIASARCLWKNREKS